MSGVALSEWMSGVNPGLFLMGAGLLAFFARGVLARGVVLLGGPLLAFLALMFAGEWGVDLATAELFGVELSLYRVDSLSYIFGLAFIIAAALGGIYSLHRTDGTQDGCGLIYAGAAVAAAFVGDLISLFIYWEVTAIASVFLIWARGTSRAWASGVRYLVIQLISGLLLLAGATLYLQANGSVAFADMVEPGTLPIVGAMDIEQPGAWLILAAFGIKAAFPLIHNWLQDSYPNATETGAVVLSAFTTKLAVLMLARYFAGLDILIWIGAIMTIFPVFFAVIENDLRRVLAYSLNNQVGFMVCAIGVGSELAINGASAHAFAHIMYKALLFMSMGAVMLRVGTTKASELGGLHRTMPYTTLFCIIGALSISAVPLFSGFAAKSMTMSALGEAHMMWVWLMLLFASAGVLEHSGIKIPYCAFFAHDSGKRPEEAPFNMLLAMGIAAALCIGVGVAPGWLYSQLPYREVAEHYLAHDLWTPTHLVMQFQLIAFATLAFVLMKRYQLYPAEKPGVILDVEWSWRRAAPGIVGVLLSAWLAIWNALSTGISHVLRKVFAGSRQVFEPRSGISRAVPLAATAVSTVLILGAVLIISLM